MSTELVASPFGTRNTAVAETAGAMQSQSRELAETQVKYLLAQRFPRDVVANMDKILNAFTRPTLAEKATYQFARGGQDINGPSIRAAEAIAQQWGNLEQGFRELSRGIAHDGVPFSEVEAYCTDLESRTGKRLQFIVRHWRDTKKGGYKLTDERDIYELVSNQAQRRVRACILAVIPGDVTEAAMAQADVTVRAKADVSPEATKKLLEAFAEFGVSKEQIEKRIQRRVDAIQPAQVISLRRIYASLRDDMSTVGDWFEQETNPEGAPAANPTTGASGLKAAMRARGKGKKQEEPPPADEPASKAEDATPASTTPTANDFVMRIDASTTTAEADAVLKEARAAGLADDQLAIVVDAHRIATADPGPADQQ